jgi:hypothetical protein
MKNKNSNGGIKLSRREILLGSFGLFGTAIFAASSLPDAQAFNFLADGKDDNPLTGSRLFRDVEIYARLGEHRTATEVDLKTSVWIEKELRTAGFTTAFQSFKSAQFFPSETSLKIGKKSFEAFPLWFPKTTNPRVLRAPLRKTDAAVSEKTRTSHS